ncbi:tRNA (adenosine(37)-N6)-threonylcarbamoyltransferase complex dimerization subunit type 1 TsaB [Candidatus Deianiraea vastatrix]|uniref:tRNA threonylcarbamoyladenosine biosynthesis protein TsaB n=1 Tax=Candidatus Deianiraea vastatrix TaxID=2163644 RepID=A0A5B8XEA8_9RICK|nr:tRNA (adenosine(37)-N6)-threonylcarbamoyltransferase complex dimerization subunit type 1 TsaB [Candidatus Deianiraea vastatrix]QED23679.1 tRNA threonylcarbamoyladenosine biosynthesis protein TsaB [Candidatus Deianiraea vastatrix]
MTHLAIDTANAYLSLALKHNNSIHTFLSSKINAHAEILIQEIDNLLANQNLKLHNITDFIINLGPGSFTGLRIASSYLAGLLAFNKNPSIHSIDTFDISYSHFLLNNPNTTPYNSISVILKADSLNSIFIKTYNPLNHTITSNPSLTTLENLNINNNTLYILEDSISNNLSCDNKIIATKTSPIAMITAASYFKKTLDKNQIISPKYLRTPF